MIRISCEFDGENHDLTYFTEAETVRCAVLKRFLINQVLQGNKLASKAKASLSSIEQPFRHINKFENINNGSNLLGLIFF